MNYKDWDILSENDIFSGLSPQQIGDVLPCITQRVQTFGQGEKIYAKGDSVSNLGIVLEGELSVCDFSVDGVKTITANLYPNQMFGEVVIFATGGTVPHDVYATEKSTVIFLTSDFFLRPCGQQCQSKEVHGKIMQNMLRILSDRAMLLARKISYLTAPDLKTKIAMYLCDLYEVYHSQQFQTPLNRDELAEFLAVARPSLSREFSNLKTQGLIDFYRSQVTILDLDQLYQIAKQGE